MVAFTASCIVLVLLMVPIVVYRGRRPVGATLTWGEAMVAATYCFLILFWAYGVVPHQWLTWADNDLKWRPDKFLYGPGDILKPRARGGNLPLTITYQTLRDLIAVGIYGVLLGLNIALWPWWQNRNKTKTKAVEVSAFGRPLVREGAN